MRTPLLLCLLPILACSSAPPSSPAAPAAPSASAASISSLAAFEPPGAPAHDPFAMPVDLRAERERPRGAAGLVLPRAEGALARVPAACEAYSDVKPGTPPACTDRASALAALATAIEADDPARDQALARLSGCAALPAPLIPVLRAAYAPVLCGEALVGPLLASTAPDEALLLALKKLHPEAPAPTAALARAELLDPLRDVALGQAVASRMNRIATEPVPSLAAPISSERIMQFTRGPAASWARAREAQLADAAALLAKLPGDSYGLALATSELGLTCARWVRALRAAPVPDEMKRDDEARTAYFQAIDALSEPLRREAIRLLAEAGTLWARRGVLRDREASAVHASLSRLTRGRLGEDDLLPAAPVPGTSVEERLAAGLPVFASERLFSPVQALRPEILGALLRRGFAWSYREHLGDEGVTPRARLLGARGYGELGLRWREASHFDGTLRALGARPPGGHEPEAAFWAALALAYRRAVSSLSSPAVGAPPIASSTEALESIARASPPGPFAPHAQVSLVSVFDLSPPSTDAIEFHRGQLGRLLAAQPAMAPEADRKRVEQMISDRRAILQFIEAGQ